MAATPIKAEAITIEKSGVKIVRNPPESKLTELGVRSWPKWGCEPSKFPWTYSAKETCFLLEGKVKVHQKDPMRLLKLARATWLCSRKG